jgi:hypothetical protein
MKLVTIMASAALGLAASATAASAADLLIHGPDPIYDSPMFNFEGFYVGGSLGAGNFTSSSGGVGLAGVVAGDNMALGDSMLAGLEFQGDAVWNDDGFVGIDALFLGKLGFYLTDSTLIYGQVGTGWLVDDASYALGAGIEQAIAGNFSVRGDAMATGAWGDSFDGGKAEVSLIWHLD